MTCIERTYIQLLFNSAGFHPLTLYRDTVGVDFDENNFGIVVSCYSEEQNIPIKTVRLSAFEQYILEGRFDISPAACELKSLFVEDISRLDDFIQYSPLNLVYFSFFITDLKSIRLKIKIILRNSGSEVGDFIMNSFFTGYQLMPISNGNITGALLEANTDRICGHISFDYLVAKPWSNLDKYASLPGTDLSHLGKPILIGHRGSGCSYTELPSLYMENTIDSFLKASDSGAPFVELDVQLTRDLHVIVYHDFLTEPITSREDSEDSCEEQANNLDIPIRDLNLSQLKFHRFMHATMPNHNDKQYRANSTTSERPTGCMFPLLHDVMRRLPKNVGINIELKFPQQDRDGSWELEGTYFDRNLLVEKVLDVVCFESINCNRPIIFSSFDPGICIMLSHKQNLYPVLFLVEENNDPARGYADFRTRAVKTAILFATAERLQGICSCVKAILPIISDVISSVHERSLHLFTYGCENNNTENITIQSAAGVDGIIFDRIYDFMPVLNMPGGVSPVIKSRIKD